MRSDPYFTIITCYHFNRSDGDKYASLLRSLRASLREVGKRGRLILVANGVNDGAELPSVVIKDLNLSDSMNARIEPVSLLDCSKNVGGLNAGIVMAIEFPPDAECEWIGQVQSSVVLQPRWLDIASDSIGTDPCIGAVFGRIVYEDDVSMIWADGHRLVKGQTRNVNFDKKAVLAVESESIAAFPCLSAVIFKKSLVEGIVRRFGNFVCEILPHYGDCTDVALRAQLVNKNVVFKFCKGARSLKRRPYPDNMKIACSQLLVASLYYKDRRLEAEIRIKKNRKYRHVYIDAKRQVDCILRGPYCPNIEELPPSGMSIDLEWRMQEREG